MSEILFETSTIGDGNMSFKFGAEAEVNENRQRFVEECGIPVNRHICMACDHGEEIIAVNRDTRGVGALSQTEMPVAEVLVTNEPRIALMVLTADCLPMGFYDPVRKVIALAHVSRKTTTHRLAQKTISFLHETYDSNPADIHVTVGPYIHTRSYAFPTPLESIDETLTDHITYKNNRAYVDLQSANRAQLTAAGVPAKQIIFSDIDTYTSPDHFSHMKSKETGEQDGRIATIMML